MFLRKIAFLNRKNASLTAFLFSIFILKLYPFYAMPFQSVAFSSHTIAKLLIIAVFLKLVLKGGGFFQKTLKNKTITFLMIAYFVGQSLSVIGAQDVLLFLKFYHNLIVGVLIFWFAYYHTTYSRNSLNIFFYFATSIGIILVIIELLFRIFINQLIPFLQLLLQKEVSDTLLSNVSQGKYVLALSSEMFLPFFLLLAFSQININYRFILSISSIALIFLSVISNFRTRIVCLFFSILLTIVSLLYKKRFQKNPSKLSIFHTSIIIIISLISTVYLAIISSNVLYSYNIVDRLFLEDSSLDEGTIQIRINQNNLLLDLFSSSPLFGIGLGNYSYFIPINPISSPTQTSYQMNFSQLSESRPHNIFFQHLGETGILGIVTFTALLFYFAKRDLHLLSAKRADNRIIAFSISSWIVIVYGLFNPADTIYVLGWFWFARGTIEGYAINST